MTKNETDPPQVETGDMEPPPKPVADESPPPSSRNSNKVYRSGPLFLSSKGIGWTSWKKRWFILTSTSLVFFRNDPNAVLPKGAEVNCTLGGIDLNSSGSVVVKEDKKLITVQFSDGREGRTFTLKAETLEDLNEWKVALEQALENAPAAACPMSQNGISKSDQANAADASVDQSKDSKTVKVMVIGGPVLLALENTDGTPSFLEKALRFVEKHGVQVEGILRQAADVEDVERRISEYEQGKTDFSPEEDAHVIADCVKYVLRELSSSPIPASCCKALVEAGRAERSKKLAAMRNAIYETFPEPNCRLLQRILMMMQTIAANKAQNRMSVSAVAACMAPLLLRPLLAGECEVEQKADVAGDGSAQLLQAAAAANNAQAICITLLEEYDNLFGEGTMVSDRYSETDESGSESEELSDEGETSGDYSDDDATNDTDGDMEEDSEHTSNGSKSESEECDQSSGSSHSGSLSEEYHETVEVDKKLIPTVTSNNINEGGEWARTEGNKNLSVESKDLPFEEEADTWRLEASKAELQSKLAEQAKGNEPLLESLERRRNALLDCRLALEKDVTTLQEKLQKESELTTVLEAGFRVSQGPTNISAPIDDKTMKKLGEISRVELDINNLKQKADDLRSQLIQQREQNFRLQHMNDTQNDFGLSSALNDNEKLQRSKHHSLWDRTDSVKDKRREITSSSSKHSSQHMRPEALYNSKSTGVAVSASFTEPGIGRPASTNSRRSGSRGEGIIPTTSVLSKLTSRLNFMNQKKGQTGNELESSEKDRNTGQPVHSLERGSGSESGKSSQSIDKSPASEGNSSDRGGRILESYRSPYQFHDTGSSEGHPSLERRKSDSLHTADKRKSEFPPRTYSR